MKKSTERIFELITGYLLLIPGFIVVISLLLYPGSTDAFGGKGVSFSSGWSRYFFRHIWTTTTLPEANLSISLIIIAMTLAGVYLIKSKPEL